MTFQEKVEMCRNLPIKEVCESYGLRFHGIYAKSPSGRGGNNFTISERKNMFTDWSAPSDMTKNGVAQGNPINFVMYMTGCDFKTAVDLLCNQFGTAPTVVRDKPQRHEAKSLSPEELDKAYRIFLGICYLDAKGRKYLRGRGLSDEDIARYGFMTMPRSTRMRKALNYRLRQAGINPAAVPGLYVPKGERDATFDLYDGIAIPVKNVDGLIAGIQVRRENVAEGAARYVWFSSYNKTGEYDGKSPGTPIGFYGSKAGKTLLITEGAFKAIAIYKAWHNSVMTVQGVGNFGGLGNEISKMSLNRVVIAYDADFVYNANVLNQAIRLYEEIHQKQSDVSVSFALWDMSLGKGLDDVIEKIGKEKAGKAVRSIPMDSFAEKVKPFLMEKGNRLYREGKREDFKTEIQKIISEI